VEGEMPGLVLAHVAEGVYHPTGHTDRAAGWCRCPVIADPVFDFALEYVEDLLVLLMQVWERKATTRRQGGFENRRECVPGFRSRFDRQFVRTDLKPSIVARRYDAACTHWTSPLFGFSRRRKCRADEVHRKVIGREQ
jgi:hypothetical protein